MSIPENPLSEHNTSLYRNVLVAFKYADDASKANVLTTAGDVGESIPNTGPNIIIVNEFKSRRFTIEEAIWDFNFIPEIGVTTSASTGIVAVDEEIPNSFLSFLRETVIAELGEDTSISHMGFVLKTFFMIGEEENGNNTIVGNPYIFTVDHIDSLVNDSDPLIPNTHVLNCMAISNTTALLRSFSNMYQMTITHKDGNLHDEVPEPFAGSSGLQTRGEENKNKNRSRKNKLDQSKPMKTLKDVFDGLEVELNQQKFTHKAQLQQWLRNIRNDHVDKITVPPQQSKPPLEESLPIDFKIDLDPIYQNYPIDNRNMPFEQPSVNQEEIGIRSFPVKIGTNLFQLINKIMHLSKSVGEEANPSLTERKKAFKITLSAIRQPTNRYLISIKIRRYTIPLNEIDGIDTGPGDSAVDPDNPLHFFTNDVFGRDSDILSLTSRIAYEVGDIMLENQINNEPQAGIVFADREPATAERRPDLNFFRTMYSGLRPSIANYVINGLESAENSGHIFNMLDPYTFTQTTEYNLEIRGNPYILSDVNRLPHEVVNDEEGETHYFRMPETYPMYVRLTMFERSLTEGGEEAQNDIPKKFYYDGFYHVTRVVNIFGVWQGKRGFKQHLVLRRSDDTV